MKVVPTLTVPAAYVGLLVVSETDLVARTYDADGNTLADVGSWATPGLNSGDPVVFVRGGTEGSLAGCSMAFLVGTDLYLVDLEALDLVAVATTHRAAETGGLATLVTIRAGSGVVWECGVLAGPIAHDPGTDQVGWLRRISQDGQTIDSIAAGIPNPFAGVDNGTGTISTHGSPIINGATTWAIGFVAQNDSPNLHLVAMKQVTEAGVVTDLDNRYLDSGDATTHGSNVSIERVGGVVLQSQPVALGMIGSGQNPGRVVVDTDPLYFDDADSRYIVEDLLDLTSLTVQALGTLRTDGQLVALVSEGSTDSHKASRLCTYSGSHPITASTAGPAFERDDTASEVLLVVFGL